jgi:hypothetical protein
MASFISNLRRKLQHSTDKENAQPATSPTENDTSNSSEKQTYLDGNEPLDAPQHDASIPKDAEAGELTLDETAAGGLGRHLGVFSTTFLM